MESQIVRQDLATEQQQQFIMFCFPVKVTRVTSFAYMHLCRQSDASAFEYEVQVCHSFPSKEQVSFNFTAALTIHSGFGAQENKICHCFHFSPSICYEVMGWDAMILVFNVECQASFIFFPLSSFTLIKKLFSCSSLSAVRVVSSAYLRLFIFLPAVLIPAC